LDVKQVDLSVVIPVYNEEDNILPLLEEISAVLSKMGMISEILAVNDGSTDLTLNKLNSARKKYSNLRILNLRRNNGLSAAIDAGFKNAYGNIIVIIDADLQNDPADIPKLVSLIGENDVVCGWRKNRIDPLKKRVSSKIANFVRNLLTSEDVHDTCCGLKAFKRESVINFKMYNGLHRFLPTLLKMEGYKIAEIPVNHRPRIMGKSKYNIGNRVFKSTYDLIAVRWMKKRWMRYREDIIND